MPLQSITNATHFCHLKDPVLGGEAHITDKTVDALGTCFNYIGKVHRKMNYSILGVDNNAIEFFKEKGYQVPTSHKYANANLNAELPSVSKYGKPPPTFDEATLTFAVTSVKKYYLPIMGAACVLPVEDVVGELDQSTSNGYPLSLRYHTKREFLGTDFALPYLKNFINDQCNDQKLVPIWTSSVKAEMRPWKKVENNELRTFCAAPIEMTVAMNTLCLDMNNKFYSSGESCATWNSVGMSKFFRGWDKLARRLNKHKNGFALDVSQYDSSVAARLLEEVCEFRISCLNTSDGAKKKLLRQLYTHVINSVMVLGSGEVVQKHGGNPSGSSNTVVDNTLVLQILFVYCTAIMYRKHFGCDITYDYIIENFELALYGDDNTGMISDHAASWWSIEEFAYEASLVGFKITSEDDFYGFRPLAELKFLSSGFKHIDLYDVWVPVTDSSKNLCSLIYGCKDQSPIWSAYRANALYVEAFFNSGREIIHQYRNWLLMHNRELFQSSTEVKGIRPKDVMASWFDEREAMRLYIGEVM